MITISIHALHIKWHRSIFNFCQNKKQFKFEMQRPISYFVRAGCPNPNPTAAYCGYKNGNRGGITLGTCPGGASPGGSNVSPSGSAGIGGIHRLRDPRLNKGMAFTPEERQCLGLWGLLPAKIKTQEEQVKLCKANVDRYTDDLSKYIYLMGLLDRNEHLFYRLLAEHVEEMMPIVYTPTVGLACQQFGFAFRRPRGLYITIKDRGHIYEILKNWPEIDVRAIVVTDGERILGLGDLGAYGMGIPVGKLILYTALGGIKPHKCLPILLDVGTNTESLLVDEFYIGLKHHRVTGAAYNEFLDEFMQAVVCCYGQCTLIQFEDFGNQNAFKLLQKYRHNYCTFNDDIQGTAAVAFAGLSASLRITKKKMTDYVFLFLGAGEAALGISNLIVRALTKSGMSEKDAALKIWLCDSKGLVCNTRNDLTDEKRVFSKDAEHLTSFIDIVNLAKPTAIIGASAQANAFNEETIRKMAELNERPVIFALSNPTSKAECTAEDAYTFTEGRGIFASGSPFPPVMYKDQKFEPGQGNNAYIFPGVALGVITAGIRHISEDVFLLAANTLASLVKDEDLAVGRLYPPHVDIYKVSLVIARVIVEDAYARGQACICPEPIDKEKFIRDHLYDFKYSKPFPSKFSR